MGGQTRKKLTTFQIANMLGVSDQSISNWIDDGRLRAERTPGGHRRVEPDELIAFLRQQDIGIPPELLPATPTILIVDDEKEIAQWIAKMLHARFSGFHIHTASDGYAAGQAVLTQRPQLVILDLYMPGMDGFEVCRRIKADPQTRNTVVVAVTGHPSPEAEEAIRAAGAAAYLPKPLDAKSICTLVHNLLPIAAG